MNAMYLSTDYAQVMAAYLSGKALGVVSAGTCTLMPGDAEDIYNVVSN